MKTYYMPTKIDSGPAAIEATGQRAVELGIKHILVVTDEIIAAKPFFETALASLAAAGVAYEVFDKCGIDARLNQVDDCARRIKEAGMTGVIGIGGGSAMCTAKAIAMVVTNCESFRDCAGIGNVHIKSIPNMMIPTTAGSGAEVSQFTLVKDEERNAKLLGGGPVTFPDVAILDPVVLDGIPERVALVSVVDALSHSVEALFTSFADPLTDGLALTAFAEIIRSAEDKNDTEDRRMLALLASSVANMACGNARLGLAHAASLPLEANYHLPHGIGVGVLLPRVLRFNAPVMPHKTVAMASALGLTAQGSEATDVVVERLFSFYDNIGFPRTFEADAGFRDNLEEMAQASLPGLYGMPVVDDGVNAPVVQSPNIRPATVADVVAIYEQCW